MQPEWEQSEWRKKVDEIRKNTTSRDEFLKQVHSLRMKTLIENHGNRHSKRPLPHKIKYSDSLNEIIEFYPN